MYMQVRNLFCYKVIFIIVLAVNEHYFYLAIFHRLLYMLESSTGSPDDMKKLVTEAVTQLDMLMNYLPSHTVV